MNPVPNPETLAAMVTKVTQTMFGMTFSLDTNAPAVTPWKQAPVWRMVLLPITGARPITVALAADDAGGTHLCKAMFACDDVDAGMVEDSLGELVNIIAGQVKGAMGLDQKLGLPKVVGKTASQDGHDGRQWHSATVKHGDSKAVVWVAITESAI